MLLLCLLTINILLVSAVDRVAKLTHNGYCDSRRNDCHKEDTNTIKFEGKKLLFYDVNPPEGFNLRRDVYMRFAIMLSEAQNRGQKVDWHLVLPPWHNLYHWRSETERDAPKPWSMFFNINKMRKYAKVLELHDIMQNSGLYGLKLDTIYVLQNYEDLLENGVYRQKWNIVGPCSYEGNFWGYGNITASQVLCVQFQGRVSKLWEIIEANSKDMKVMFAHGEIALHDSYGSKEFWDCRKSMEFNGDLVINAMLFIAQRLKCNKPKCNSYLAVHWRRQDFLHSNRSTSAKGTAKQIHITMLKKSLKIKDVFIASDGTQDELSELEAELDLLSYRSHFYVSLNGKYVDGQIAIIDQIICSRAAVFIGTHDSTFTYRIHEEREILGFDSDTTFNNLCPDVGECEQPSQWTIIH